MARKVDVYDLAVVKTKAQAEKYVKTGKYSDKSKYRTRIERTHNKHLPRATPFYTIWVYKR